MPQPTDTTAIGILGSPSTNSQVTLDLVGEAATAAVVGSLIVFEQKTGERVECAVGTITEVTTVNQWHENVAMRGVIASHGSLPNLSGRADVKGVVVRIQAAYWREEHEDTYHQLGATLSTSPTTGQQVQRVSNETVRQLIGDAADQTYYLGPIYKSDGVLLPLNLPDFDRPEGAYHMAFFGRTGSGKTACAEFELAARMGRRPNLGVLVVDPQGQWSTQGGFVFDLHKWARGLGRDVVVRRIATDLRLPADSQLLMEMVLATRFFKKIRIQTSDKAEQAVDEFVAILQGYKNTHGTSWFDDDPALVLSRLLGEFVGDGDFTGTNRLKSVYAAKESFNRVAGAINDFLDDNASRQSELEPLFAPFHNLFAATNQTGGTRHSVHGVLQRLFGDDSDGPRPLVVLDMSAESLDTGDDGAGAILERDEVKARILGRITDTIEQASRKAFAENTMLNVQVLFDEAHRYAAPSRPDLPDAVRSLSENLVRRVRETRKYGLGWSFITQTPSSLHPGLWAQLSARFVGYGLVGSDLSRVDEELDDKSSLTLYKSFADPSSTNPKVYPYMVLGPVSPLSFTKAPVFLQTFTTMQDFLDANREWLPSGFPEAAELSKIGGSIPSAPTDADPFL